MTEPKPEPDAETGAEPSGGLPASELREIADSLRNRIDLFGKTLAAVATVGTTAIGLTQITDLFPAEDNVEWVIVACVSLATAALAAVWIAARLMWVARPVFMRADLDENEELDRGEREAVRPVFAASGRRFGYSSLVGLEERERGLRQAAAQSAGEEERARRTALADEVKDELEQALARGQVVTIRRRAARATRGPLASVLYVAVIAGLIVFALATDKVTSDRRDRVAEAKACGDARTAGATAGELGRSKICDGKPTAAPTPEPLTADQARAKIAAELVSTLEACAALTSGTGVEDRPLERKECDPVRKAVSEIDPAASP
jgi:hypothetical protein